MNKRHLLSIVLVLAMIMMLFTGCSPDKKGAVEDAEPAPEDQVTETYEEPDTENPEESANESPEEQSADGEESPVDAETEPVYEDPALLENDGELSVVVPDDQGFGGF